MNTLVNLAHQIYHNARIIMDPRCKSTYLSASNVGVLCFRKSLSLMAEPCLPFLVMATIQYGWHVKDWPQLSCVRNLLSVSIFNGRASGTIFVISGNGYHSRWSTTYSSWRLNQLYECFLQVSIFNDRSLAAMFVISCNGCHPRWLTIWWLIKDGHQRSPPP